MNDFKISWKPRDTWDFKKKENQVHISRVSCQKGPTRHAYAWQIGSFWQDTLDL